jgi:hypothetical protein
MRILFPIVLPAYNLIIVDIYNKGAMNKLIEKYPYKKTFYFNWYEAAIGHLLLFKCIFI